MACASISQAQTYDCVTSVKSSHGGVSDMYRVYLDREAGRAKVMDDFTRLVSSTPLSVTVTEQREQLWVLKWSLIGIEFVSQNKKLHATTLRLVMRFRPISQRFTISGSILEEGGSINGEGTCALVS
jgi:hypothetical protein